MRSLAFFSRAWLKRPRLYLSLFIMLSFGVGIAVLTAAFGLLESALLAGNPFGDEDRIVSVDLRDPRADRSQSFHLGDIRRVKAALDHLEPASAVFSQWKDLVYENTTHPVGVGYVQAEFFRIFELQPTLGRFFTEDDVAGGNRGIALISHEIWLERFDGRSDVLGAVCRVAGEDRVILGVLPPDFAFPWSTDVWVPLIPESLFDETGFATAARLCGRLKPGSTIADVETQLSAIIPHLNNPEGNPLQQEMEPRVFLWKEYYLGDYTQSMLIALYLVALFLFIVGMGNATVLTTAGVVSRMGEFATRLSLGARWTDIGKQIAAECVFLNALGSLVGFALYFAVVRLFSASVDDALYESWMGFSFGPRSILHFVLIFSISTLFSLCSAVYRLRKASLFQLTQQNERTASSFGRGAFARFGIAAQVCMAVVAIGGALLVGRGIDSVIGKGTLFHQDNTATVIVAINANEHSTLDEKESYLRSIEAAFDEVPAVRRHCASTDWYAFYPLRSFTLDTDGSDCLTTQDCPTAFVNVVRGDYFAMADIDLVTGRTFNGFDTIGAQKKTVVNRSFVKEFYSDDPTALGKTFKLWSGESVEIVGIVEDAAMKGVGAFARSESNAGYYLSQEQNGWGHLRYFIEYEGDVHELREQLNEALMARNNEKRLHDLVTYQDFQDDYLGGSRLLLSVLTLAAVIIVVFVVISIYAFVSYLGYLKRKETGIRLAYGASFPRIVSAYGAPLVLFLLGGVGAGVGAFLFAMRYLNDLLPDHTGYLAPISTAGALAAVLAIIAVVVPLASLPSKRISDLLR